MRNKLYTLPLFIAVFAISGCSKDTQTSEEREERDPLVKSGQAYMDQELWDEAEKAFKQALDDDPLMARPHLDLAMIYQQHKPNYIHAIYHYDRYLELRPDAEKADLIREQKTKIEQALVKTIIQGSADVKQLRFEYQRLFKENAALKRQLAEAAKPAPQPTVAVAARKPETAPQPATQTTEKTTAKHKIYHVVAGDTLTKISTRFYGSSAYSDLIYNANRDSLSGPNNLKIGQTLVIPVSGE